MSLLSKLKDRLFKSSSKIEKGLETILDEEPEEASSVADNANLQEKKGEQVNHFQQTPSQTIIGKGSKDSLNSRGLLSKVLHKNMKYGKKGVVDDKLLESLEELLISADLGVSTATKISASFADAMYGKRLGKEEIKLALAEEIKKILKPVAVPISISKEKLQVVLVVGVNGSGKTTTIGKLASQFKAVGKEIKIVAADTFRAAAVEQLEIWGQRVAVPVLKAASGGDPAALVYDSILSAQKDGTDILIIDTAGRLQNKLDLMEELGKMVRVLRKVDPEAPQSTLLVLDASIGQNAINQVDLFQKTATITGIVMTKLDGSAKGGILVAIADKFKIPIHAIGIGEGLEDLQPFDPEEFTLALTGVETI